jgi:membrane protein DedA with SNARE-associated domain
VITISAGVFQLNLPVFFLASAISRAARFFLVASLFYFFGVPIKAFIDKYLGWLTILFVVLIIGGFVLLRYVM